MLLEGRKKCIPVKKKKKNCIYFCQCCLTKILLWWHLGSIRVMSNKQVRGLLIWGTLIFFFFFANLILLWLE